MHSRARWVRSNSVNWSPFSQDAIPLCERLPSPSDLWVVNRQWQRLRSSSPGGGVGGEFYLFSAHLDARRRPEEGGRAAVRVLAMVERRQPLVSHLRCLLWDDDWAAAGPPKSVPVDTATMIWGGSQSNGEIFPFLITCLLEEEDDEVLPAAVSLAMDKKVGGCNRLPSNALRVDHSDMKGIATGRNKVTITTFLYVAESIIYRCPPPKKNWYDFFVSKEEDKSLRSA